MSQTKTRRCRSCKKFYIADPRGIHNTAYCSKPECQLARNRKNARNRGHGSRYYVGDGIYYCKNCKKEKPRDEYPTNKGGQRLPVCTDCRKGRSKWASWTKADGAYPLPEWLGGLRDDLTDVELATIEYGGASACYACIHLRQCQDIVRRSAREQRVIATQCMI